MKETHLAEQVADDDGWFSVMRPYPYIVCNAEKPDECQRETDGYCPKCHIPGFHLDRA